MERRAAGWVCSALVLLLGCGGAQEEGSGEGVPTAQQRQAAPAGAPVLEAVPALVLEEAAPARYVPPPPLPPAAMRFQPAFHQALRFSHPVGSLTTFRLRIPLGRGGQRLRLAFRAGDGSVQVQRVVVAHAAADGALAGEARAVTFDGAPGFSLAARGRRVSDAVALPVEAGDELAVSFEARGALSAAAGNATALPGSWVRAGALAPTPGALGGTAWARAVGLATVEVEAPAHLAFLAIGDSITEGYVDGRDDTREAWPGVAQRELGLPFANAGVGGQGLWAYMDPAQRYFAQEVGALADSGLSDCVVLLGTNDLGDSDSVSTVTSRLAALFVRLERELGCRVWAGTLLPKERTSVGSLEEVRANRAAVNAWIRTRAQVYGVIDFEAATRSAASPDLFRDGFEGDGIHPSGAGQRALGLEAARVLRERLLPRP